MSPLCIKTGTMIIIVRTFSNDINLFHLSFLFLFVITHEYMEYARDCPSGFPFRRNGDLCGNYRRGKDFNLLWGDQAGWPPWRIVRCILRIFSSSFWIRRSAGDNITFQSHQNDTDRFSEKFGSLGRWSYGRILPDGDISKDAQK